jgi:5-methylcytosine-specific restriction endonuclease McrA
MRNRKVLVLNKGWNAIGVVSLERAIVMLFSTYRNNKGEEKPKAEIVDPTRAFQTFDWETWSEMRPKEGEDYIRASNITFRVPEVILLSRYDKMPQHKIHFSRRTIYKRDANTCQYCGCQPGTEELTIDHVMPRSRGGKTTWENCVLACVGCNSRKADRTPEEAKMVLRKKPKKPIMPLFKGDVRIKSWETWLGEAYWNTELANDNDNGE